MYLRAGNFPLDDFFPQPDITLVYMGGMTFIDYHSKYGRFMKNSIFDFMTIQLSMN